MTAGAAPVSREALAKPASDECRRYHSPFRRRQAEATRTALMKAALALIAKGNFRPTAQEIARSASGMHKSAVVRYFGGAAELHAIIAQDHPDAVLRALGIEPLDDAAAIALQLNIVWVVMTGRRRPLS